MKLQRNISQAGEALIDEAAAGKILGVEPRTIRLWRHTRGLPHYKPTSKVILFRRSDLIAWLEKFRVQTVGGAR